MLFSKDNKDKDDGTDKGAAKSLGLSKVVYGLGMSARDALVTFVVATTVLFPVMLWGQGKNGIIDKAAKFPDKLHALWKNKFGENSGKYGKALAVSGALGFLVSHLANFPGFITGPRKVKEAEEIFNNEVAANAELHKENSQLTESLKRKDLQLAEMEKKSGSFVERVGVPDASASHSVGL